jgi:hypothetical protein
MQRWKVRHLLVKEIRLPWNYFEFYRRKVSQVPVQRLCCDDSAGDLRGQLLEGIAEECSPSLDESDQRFCT